MFILMSSITTSTMIASLALGQPPVPIDPAVPPPGPVPMPAPEQPAGQKNLQDAYEKHRKEIQQITQKKTTPTGTPTSLPEGGSSDQGQNANFVPPNSTGRDVFMASADVGTLYASAKYGTTGLNGAKLSLDAASSVSRINLLGTTATVVTEVAPTAATATAEAAPTAANATARLGLLGTSRVWLGRIAWPLAGIFSALDVRKDFKAVEEIEKNVDGIESPHAVLNRRLSEISSSIQITDSQKNIALELAGKDLSKFDNVSALRAHLSTIPGMQPHIESVMQEVKASAAIKKQRMDQLSSAQTDRNINAVCTGAGAAIGMAVAIYQGTAIGAAVGSFIPIPVVGTVVGAVVGAAVGACIGAGVGNLVGKGVKLLKNLFW